MFWNTFCKVRTSCQCSRILPRVNIDPPNVVKPIGLSKTQKIRFETAIIIHFGVIKYSEHQLKLKILIPTFFWKWMMFHCNNLYTTHIQISFFKFEIEWFLQKLNKMLWIQFHYKRVLWIGRRYIPAMSNLLVLPEIVDYYFSLLSPFSYVLLPEIRFWKTTKFLWLEIVYILLLQGM